MQRGGIICAAAKLCMRITAWIGCVVLHKGKRVRPELRAGASASQLIGREHEILLPLARGGWTML